MLNEKMLNALNNQIKEELASAYIYLAVAADLEAKNLNGSAQWMKAQYGEEIGHAMKIYGYINRRGGKVVLQTLEAPKKSWDSLLDVFQTAYKHEQYITGCIDKLVKLARELQDNATEAFLQWFVSEQVEEEENTDAVVQKLKMIGDAPHVLYLIDRELGMRKE